MSNRSIQGAEVPSLVQEFLADYTASNTRDTTLKKNGEASWNLNSLQSQFFRTGKTKPGVDVIAACMMWWQSDLSTDPDRVFRFCAAGDNGGNPGRWQAVYGDGFLKIYDALDAEQAAGETTINHETWYHITLMDDGTTAYIYLNGVLECSWAHGAGAWRNLPWGPACIQIDGKEADYEFNFDDVIAFDDQDGRMDWITPDDWDGTYTWRVIRAKPVTPDVVTGFTPSAAVDHYTLVDESPTDDTSDYVWILDSHAWASIAREDGTDYTHTIGGGTAGRNLLYDLSPAGNEWTDAIFDAIATGLHNTTDDAKELLNIEDSGTIGIGSEHVRAVHYLAYQSVTGGTPTETRFYVWRDQVLIGPADPGAAVTRRIFIT